MTSVYETCPSWENDAILLRQAERDDCEDLLKVYSDEKALPFFNSDNCHGDDFHYATIEKMQQALDFWDCSYRDRWFVRWAVVDKATGAAVGTVELFQRISDDAFDGYGILRLDLISDFEQRETIFKVLSLIIPPAYGLFHCTHVATKAIPAAGERIAALKRFGFRPAAGKLVGHDGTEYGDYYVIGK